MRGHSVKSLPSPRTIDILQQYESTVGVRRRTWDTWGAEGGALFRLEFLTIKANISWLQVTEYWNGVVEGVWQRWHIRNEWDLTRRSDETTNTYWWSASANKPRPPKAEELRGAVKRKIVHVSTNDTNHITLLEIPYLPILKRSSIFL